MTRSTLRETRDTFEKLIREQKKIKSLLETERDLTVAAHADSLEKLQTSLSDSGLGKDDDSLSKLSEIAQETNVGMNFMSLKQTLMAEKKLADQDVVDFTEQYGSDDSLQQTIQESHDSLQEISQNIDALQEQNFAYADKLNDLTEHNQTKSLKITPQSAPNIKNAGFFSRLLNSELRAAHRLLTTYEGNPFEDMQTYKTLKTDLQIEQHLEQKVKDAQREAKQQLEMSQKLAQKAAEASDVQSLINARLATAFLSDEFATKAEAVFGTKKVQETRLHALKANNLQKLSGSLDAQIDVITNTISKLDAPMSKLKKGARNRPSKQIDVDAPKIASQVHHLSAFGAYRATSLSRSRSAVQSYQPQSNDNSMMQTMLLFWMISECNVDAAFAKDTVGISTEAATHLDITPETLVPNVAETLASIDGSDFTNFSLDELNIEALSDFSADIGNIDTGNVDVGNIDVGNFSVPDISIPSDIGSSGFDSGGSFGGSDGGMGM